MGKTEQKILSYGCSNTFYILFAHTLQWMGSVSDKSIMKISFIFPAKGRNFLLAEEPNYIWGRGEKLNWLQQQRFVSISRASYKNNNSTAGYT